MRFHKNVTAYKKTQNMTYVYKKFVCLCSNYTTRSCNVADSNYSGNCSGFFYEFPITETVQSDQQLLLGTLA